MFEVATGVHDDQADVREVLLDAALGLRGCGLDFDDDVAGWLGHRLGVALTPPSVAAPSTGASTPGVAVAVQVRDEHAARRGLRRLDDCAGGGRLFGWDFLDGYMILAETPRQARFYAAAAARAPLAQSTRFGTDMRRLGEPGSRRCGSPARTSNGQPHQAARRRAVRPQPRRLRRRDAADHGRG